jgi:hypothetical protein
MTVIDEILNDIPDKFQHPPTTSHKFKRDLFEFFNKPEFKNKSCIEIGSNLGYTTRVLSFLFETVIGFNEKEVDKAEKFNSDRPNVKYYGQDVYNTVLPINYGDVFLIDALHTYDAVLQDTQRSLSFKSNGNKYFIYDDYGAYPEIKKVVDDMIECEMLILIKKIGHHKGSKFTRELFDSEGVICSENKI